MKAPVVLIIRDGWGIHPGGRAQAEANGDATLLARTPFHDHLYATYPWARVSGSGEDVGLPAGQMGNSEVGHLNLGAGRIVYQDLTRINKAIRDGELAQNPVLQEAFARARGKRLHFLGLISDGGVHSHQDHLVALCQAARDAGVADLMVHAITDGRDTSPTGGADYVTRLEHDLAPTGAAIATVIGRYYAMDRDKRWDRNKLAWDEPGKWERPGWLRWESACLGMITGWGSHHYDIAHWGMDTELTGPSKVEGKGEFPENKIWNVHGPYEVHLTYPNDVKVHVSNKFTNGVRFVGDEGWIFVSRGSARATASDPKGSGGDKALDASDPKLLDPNGVTVQLYRSENHHKNWLECVKSRKAPIVPVEVGHHSFAACYVSWIAMRLGRALTWDPKAEKFIGDEAANKMLSRVERAGHGVKNFLKKTSKK